MNKAGEKSLEPNQIRARLEEPMNGKQAKADTNHVAEDLSMCMYCFLSYIQLTGQSQFRK